MFGGFCPMLDVFTRFLYAKPLRSTTEATEAFRDVLQESQAKIRQLTTDGGSEFKNQGFAAMMDQKNIDHQIKLLEIQKLYRLITNK